MTTPLSRDAYRELVDEVRGWIREQVPAGSVVLVASRGDDELTRIDGYRAWHFPRDQWGAYAGHHPANSADAIAHLRGLYLKGARYLVFPSTAAWWLEHYRELAEHLHACHHLVASDDGVGVMYELRDSAAFAAFNTRGGDEQSVGGFDARDTVPLVSLVRPVAPPTLHVLTILARFGADQYAGAEEDIKDLFARQMPAVDHDVVIVDNALTGDVITRCDRVVVLGGDNSSGEFSAFDRAIDFIGSAIWSYDFVHFATSAFKRLYVAYLDRFDEGLLRSFAGRPACVGHVDCYNAPIEVLGFRAQHWIRSCFFVMPPAELKALGSFVSVADGQPFFTGSADDPFRADAPISAQYRAYIRQWLTGGDIGQGVEWHSKFALTRDTLPAFEQKARAILNEQLLSIRLLGLGCRLVDVTWLASVISRHGAIDIPWATSWRAQLANRDRDAVVGSV
jgi:hypothetical protein